MSNKQNDNTTALAEQLFTPASFFHSYSWDVEKINQVSFGWDNRWTQIHPGDLEITMKMFNTPRLQFSWMTYTNAILIEGSHPSGSIALSLIKTKAPVASHNHKIDPYELVIFSEHDDVDYLAKGENQIFALVVEANLFYNSFLWYFGYPFEEIKEKRTLSMTQEHADRYILQMQRWLYYFQENRHQKLNLEQYFVLEEKIIDQLFTMIDFKEIKRSKERFDLAQVREVIHENIDNIYTISDLLKEIKISPRTMQYHFKQKFGLTPKQYLHYLRLNAIKKKLIHSDPNQVKISDIALEYGFFNASHFGSEFKKLFGESPSQTLQQLL